MRGSKSRGNRLVISVLASELESRHLELLRGESDLVRGRRLVDDEPGVNRSEANGWLGNWDRFDESALRLGFATAAVRFLLPLVSGWPAEGCGWIDLMQTVGVCQRT